VIITREENGKVKNETHFYDYLTINTPIFNLNRRIDKFAAERELSTTDYVRYSPSDEGEFI
jgi:hypothetical protein